MELLKALVVWPSAPLTERLVQRSLELLHPQPDIVTELDPSPSGNILQWSTYDSINHDLTYSAPSGSKVLSSSYVIRKALIRKHYLSRCIHNYLTKHSESSLKASVPRTWDLELSFADELDEMWSDDLYDLGEELDKADSQQWWILKPGMADRGMGIRLFHTKDELIQIFEGFDLDSDEDEDEDEQKQIGGPDTGVATSQLRHFVIQEYLSKPLLLDPRQAPLDGKAPPNPSSLQGHKFHLRVYCVASGALSVYMYTRVLALFSAVPYSSPGADGSTSTSVNEALAAHITNTSLQTDRGEEGVRLLDELVGCRILSSASYQEQSQVQQLQPRARSNRSRMLGETIDVDQIRAQRGAPQKPVESDIAKHHEVVREEDLEDLRSQIASILAETFKAALDMSVHFQPLPNAFELFGVDFLVTHAPASGTPHKLQAHLLEVNSEPAIELTGPRLTWILEDLFAAMGKVCVAPFFGAPGPAADSWPVGETREALRKCLDVEVRGSKGW